MERSIEDLSRYRYQCCLEALEDANVMFATGRYKNTLNRSYYACFYAIRSVCALDGFDSSKHGRVIAHFNQCYVKTGIFPKEASKLLKMASESRENADYLDFFIASKDDAVVQMSRAEQLRGWIEEYLKSKGIL